MFPTHQIQEGIECLRMAKMGWLWEVRLELATLRAQTLVAAGQNLVRNEVHPLEKICD
jgi:hypothetical protein